MPLRESQEVAPTLSYFDGQKAGGRFILFVALITLGIFFDSFDLSNFGYTAPTITKYWGLNMGWVGRTNALGMVGQMIGSLLGGWFSDKAGRKKGFLVGVTCYGVATILCGIAPTPLFFVICRFLTMVGTMGLSVIAMVYISEMAPAEKRGKLGLRTAGLALTAVPLAGLFARWVVTLGPEGWRLQYYLSGTFGLVIVVLVYFLCYESPRWLVSKGRAPQAKAILDKLLPDVTTDLSLVTAATQNHAAEERLGTLKALMTMWNSFYRGRTILLMLVAMVVCNTASTISMMMPTLFKARGLTVGNSILLVSLMSWGAPIGVFCASFFLDKGARKLTLALSGMIAAIAFCTLGFTTGFAVMAVLGLITQLSSPISYFSSQVYSAESFATNMRSTAQGAVIGAGRIAAALWLAFTANMYGALGFSGFLTLTAACLFAVMIGVLLFGHQTSRRSLEAISEEA